MVSVEILISGDEMARAARFMSEMPHGAARAGMSVKVTNRYIGKSDWLCLYGPGSPRRNPGRLAHMASGRPVASWDMGYWGRKEFMRVSINHVHPQEFLDRTRPDPVRLAAHGITLREDYDENGPVIVIGLGPKSRRFLELFSWEVETLKKTQERFPGKKIVYRPKPQGARDPHIAWQYVDGNSEIYDLLRGASLAVCRHSNVAVDACIAGVPVECEDGAAQWLYRHGTTPTAERRLDFLQRLSRWQWKQNELTEAWKFLLEVGHA